MAEMDTVGLLKSLLQREVELFCRRLDPFWNDIQHIVDLLRRNDWRAVFFGGTLRSLLMSRLVHGRPGQPRDVDIVIQGAPLEILRELFGGLISRETRFGGFHLQDAGWEFDVWPLERTWGIVEDKIDHPHFAHLPSTTFLNIEAAAIDIWPGDDGTRRVYSGDDQFFRAIIDRVVEVNRVENPFPELCVVRSLVLTSELGFWLGPRLARYIVSHGATLSNAVLEAVQRKHYGEVRVAGDLLKAWIEVVSATVGALPSQPVRLPVTPEGQKVGLGEYPYDFLRTVHRWAEGRKHPA